MNNLDDLGQPWSCEQWGESHQVENPIIIDGQSCLDCNNNYPFVNWFGYAYTDYVFLDHNMKVYYCHYNISSYLANSIIQEMLDVIPSLGDINDDGALNILDLVQIANLILDNVYDEVADLNEDDELNILDLVTLVNWILYGMPENTAIDWITVPAGTYTYGESDEILSINYDYQISKYEITNTQYVTYLENALSSSDIYVLLGSVLGYYTGDEENAAGDYIYLELADEHCRIIYDGISFSIVDGYEDHPVVEVSWFGANSFAEYYGWRLPDEYEWEKAARGDTGYNYPFGNSMNGRQANYYDSGDPYEQAEWSDWPNTSPIGFYNGQNVEDFVTIDSPSPYGVYDMAGNVWEYTASWYFDGSPLRVRRGGSWYVGLTSGWCRSWLRDGNTPSGTYYDIGFRVARTN